MVGLDILLKRISGYADSDPGKNAIINLKPTIPKKKRLLSFIRLREIQQILTLVPSLKILKKDTVPEKGRILTGEQILHYKKLLDLASEVKNVFTENNVLEKLQSSLDPVTSLCKEISNYYKTTRIPFETYVSKINTSGPRIIQN